RKELSFHLVTQHANFPSLVEIGLADRPSAGRGHCADLLVNGSDAVDRKLAGVILAAKRFVTSQLWCHMLNEVTVLLNGANVIKVETDPSPGALPTGLQCRPATPKDNDVGAHLVHEIAITDLETITDGNHENDGSNTPGDAEHREETSKLVRP